MQAFVTWFVQATMVMGSEFARAILADNVRMAKQMATMENAARVNAGEQAIARLYGDCTSQNATIDRSKKSIQSHMLWQEKQYQEINSKYQSAMEQVKQQNILLKEQESALQRLQEQTILQAKEIRGNSTSQSIILRQKTQIRALKQDMALLEKQMENLMDFNKIMQ